MELTTLSSHLSQINAMENEIETLQFNQESARDLFGAGDAYPNKENLGLNIPGDRRSRRRRKRGRRSNLQRRREIPEIVNSKVR